MNNNLNLNFKNESFGKCSGFWDNSCLFSALPIFWLFLIRREVGNRRETSNQKRWVCSTRSTSVPFEWFLIDPRFHQAKNVCHFDIHLRILLLETAFLIDQNHKPDGGTDCRWKVFSLNFGIKGSLLTNSSQQSPQFISASLGIHSVNSFLPCVSRNPIHLSSLA